MNRKMELNEMQLEKILGTVGIEGAIKIVVKEIVRQDTDQIILLAEFRGGNSERKHLAYVNYKQGYPTTDQVFDSIYGIGRGSDLRIIMFNNKNGYDEKNPAAEQFVVSTVIEGMNEYQENLGLVQSLSDDGVFQKVGLYSVDLYKNEATFPTEEQFRAEEFWSIYFDSLNSCFYEPEKIFQYGLRTKDDWGHMLYLDPIAEMPVYWSDDGIKYKIMKCHDDNGELEEVLFAARHEIISRYGHDNVSFKYDYRNFEFTIHYSVLPFSWLMIATPEEKAALAEKLHTDMFSLRWRLQEIYHEIDDKMRNRSVQQAV